MYSETKIIIKDNLSMTITRVVDIDALVEDTIQKVQLSEGLLLSSRDVIELIQQLKEFELGQSMLMLGSLTSSWVDYMCHNKTSPTNHPLETWFLSKAPKIRAARERYYITQNLLQMNLQSNMNFCVLPCGVISKVAELDYSKIERVNVIGYDNDIQGLIKAERAMQPLVDQRKVNLLLLKKNIWLLEDLNQHDLIISNRLSVLESDVQKVLELFQKYYAALKSKGVFISSFFTPSPIHNLHTSPWVNVDIDDMLMEHSIFVDIMEFRAATRTENEMRSLLHEAGFDVVEVHYDTHRIYPTVVARKA